MRTVRGVCGSATGLAAALALVVLGAPQAVAGGPTSVLLVSPESEESAALTIADAEYGRLEHWLGEARADMGRRERPPGLDVGDGSRQINVTWMAHDVRPWRVDRVYPAASGTGKDTKKGAKETTRDVWVHTSTDLDSMTGYWHRAKEPARLTGLLKKLGVMGQKSDEGRPGIAPAPASTPPPAQAASGRTGGSAGEGGTDWWWAI
ncbi:hypothetical protein, partial [Streptomyces sp. MZ04]|uniref:hypothetical protein n=1 Tax=Streptomyces sp. MZ04 TaxID=2559236 RepID=UPI00107EC14C